MKGVDGGNTAGGAGDDEVEDESDADDDMMRNRERVQRPFWMKRTRCEDGVWSERMRRRYCISTVHRT
jgi:hypothetical protein